MCPKTCQGTAEIILGFTRSNAKSSVTRLDPSVTDASKATESAQATNQASSFKTKAQSFENCTNMTHQIMPQVRHQLVPHRRTRNLNTQQTCL